jgi:hypothetical protein
VVVSDGPLGLHASRACPVTSRRTGTGGRWWMMSEPGTGRRPRWWTPCYAASRCRWHCGRWRGKDSMFAPVGARQRGSSIARAEGESRFDVAGPGTLRQAKKGRCGRVGGEGEQPYSPQAQVLPFRFRFRSTSPPSAPSSRSPQVAERSVVYP